MGLEVYIPFVIAAVLLTVAPGPDAIYIVTRTLAQGWWSGFLSSWGIYCGAAIHVVAAALGLSAILASSALAFSVVKYVGAAYLLWLGIQALRSKGTGLSLDGALPILSPWRVFGQGVLVNLLNPKMSIFFLAFLPQFISPDRGPVFVQILALGATVIAIGIVWEAGLILCADRIAGRLRQSRRLTRWMDRAVGAVLVGLGIRLALQER